MSEHRVFRKIVVSWVVSLCLAVILITGIRNNPEPKATCTILSFTTALTLFGSILGYFIPVILIIFVNITIWIITRRHQKRLHINVQVLHVARATVECSARARQSQRDYTKQAKASSSSRVARVAVECTDRTDKSQRQESSSKISNQGHTSPVFTVARAAVEFNALKNKSQSQEDIPNTTNPEDTLRQTRASSEGNVSTFAKRKCIHENIDQNQTKIDFLLSKKRGMFSLTRTIKQEIKTFKTFLIIIGTFIALWSPFYVVLLMNLVRRVSTLLFYITIILTYCNSALNVFIYAIFSQEFRKALIESLKC